MVAPALLGNFCPVWSMRQSALWYFIGHVTDSPLCNWDTLHYTFLCFVKTFLHDDCMQSQARGKPSGQTRDRRENSSQTSLRPETGKKSQPDVDRRRNISPNQKSKRPLEVSRSLTSKALVTSQGSPQKLPTLADHMTGRDQDPAVLEELESLQVSHERDLSSNLLRPIFSNVWTQPSIYLYCLASSFCEW